MLARMQKANVRLLLVDTEEENKPALSFFAKHGFTSPIKHIYLDLNLTDLLEKRKANGHHGNGK
jgi:ribosomal protein S18 acetylase RimI-like enzyme